MKINTIVKDKIYNVQNKFFDIFIIISYILIFITALGLSQNAPKLITILDYYIRIYICLFLIWRFNPFVKIKFTELDRKIGFSAGLFILTTTAMNKYLINFTNKVKSFI